MLVEFFENNNLKNVARPLTTKLFEKDIIMKQDADVSRPSFIMDYTTDFNYCYIDKYKRFYFCKITHINNKQIFVECEVNPLHSWINDVLENECNILRNEFIKSTYLIDDEYKAQAYEQIVTKTFPNGLNDNSLVLMVVA